MSRFTRDFGLLFAAVLLPLGAYMLAAGMENRSSSNAIELLLGATLIAIGVVGVGQSVRAHFMMREYMRYVRGKSRDGA